MLNKYFALGFPVMLVITLIGVFNFQSNYFSSGFTRSSVDEGVFAHSGIPNETEINNILYSDATHVMMYPKPEYLQGYANPCFLVGKDKDEHFSLTGSKKKHSEMFKFTACFPSIFIAGFRKCGSTDIFKVLCHHSSIQKWRKEFHFFSASPHFNNLASFKKDSYTVLDYITLLKSPTLLRDQVNYYGMEKKMVDDSTSSNYGKTLLLGDCSPGYSDVALKWKLDPMNKGLPLPRYTIPHRIHHLVPLAKILFILRNPMERTWSSFRYNLQFPRICKLFNCHNETSLAMQFHQGVKRAISQWHLCEIFYKGDSRMCFYHYGEKEFLSNKLERKHFNQKDKLFIYILGATLYYIPLSEYYNVFPKGNILIIDLENYTANRWKFMNDVILPFLNLSPFAQNETSSINTNAIKMGDIRLAMLPETRNMLHQFYAPYQRKLTALRKWSSVT